MASSHETVPAGPGGGGAGAPGASRAARPGLAGGLLSPRLLVFVCVSTIAVLGVPLTVAFDSYLYVQSSRHVFGAGALTGYHWIREPLYPVIIKVVRAVGGNADVWLIWAQLGALFLAAYLAARAILGRSDRWVLGTALLAALNPMALGYAGAVLQTVWIMLIVAAHCALIAKAWRDPFPATARYLLALLGLTVISAHLSFQLTYLSFATGFALGFRLLRASTSVSASRARERMSPPLLWVGSLAVGLVLGLGAVAVGVASLQPWLAYKQAVTAGAATDELGLGNSADTSAVNKLDQLLSQPSKSLDQLVNRPLEMLGLRTPMFEENPLFGLAPFTPEQRCGKLYWAETMPGPVEETGQLLQPTCKSRLVHAAIGLFIRPGAWLYHASSLAFLVAIPILLVTRRWQALILGPPIVLLFMYAAIDASIDRYAFPIYPIGVALLVAGLRWLAGRVGGSSEQAGEPTDRSGSEAGEGIGPTVPAQGSGGRP